MTNQFFPKTFFALDPDGTFHETTKGIGSWDVIIEDIATGQYEVAYVYRAWGDKFEDVSKLAADEIYRLLRRRGPGKAAFVPSFLVKHDALGAALLRDEWKHADEIEQDRRDNAADRARDAVKERMLEAAE